MTATLDWKSELPQLLTRIIDGECTFEDRTRLNELLQQGDLPRHYYRGYMEMHATLELQLSRQDETEVMRHLPTDILHHLPISSAFPLSIDQQKAIFPIDALATPRSLFNYLSSGWPLAYLVATVILGIGLVIGAITHVSNLDKSVGSGQGAVASKSNSQFPIPNPSSVGRVTGMVDCNFSDSATLTFAGAYVSIGRKYALSSGLMEITYDSGAKVILQGLCTYEVTSPTAGYLSIGKITARIEKSDDGKGENGVASAENQKYSPPVTCSLFSVETPTATVTDLGTEFGVEVSKDRCTVVHVLQGAVDMQIVAPEGGDAKHKPLTAGQATQISPQSKTFQATAYAPQSFVRKMPNPKNGVTPAENAYINAVLADRPLAYWPLNEPAGSRLFADRSDNGLRGRSINSVVAGAAGPFGEGSRAAAFDGRGYIEPLMNAAYVEQFSRLNPLTVEAWAWIASDARTNGRIISVDNEGGKLHVGWGAAYVPRESQFMFNTYSVKNYRFDAASKPNCEQWLHVAFIYDQASGASFYLNGRLQQAVAWPQPANVAESMHVAIGCMAAGAEHWRGRLAHVAVYPAALDARRILGHYQAGRDGREAAHGF